MNRLVCVLSPGRGANPQDFGIGMGGLTAPRGRSPSRWAAGARIGRSALGCESQTAGPPRPVPPRSGSMALSSGREPACSIEGERDGASEDSTGDLLRRPCGEKERCPLGGDDARREPVVRMWAVDGWGGPA